MDVTFAEELGEEAQERAEESGGSDPPPAPRDDPDPDEGRDAGKTEVERPRDVAMRPTTAGGVRHATGASY